MLGFHSSTDRTTRAPFLCAKFVIRKLKLIRAIEELLRDNPNGKRAYIMFLRDLYEKAEDLLAE